MRFWPSFLVVASVLAASPAPAQSSEDLAEKEARVQQLHKRAEALRAALAGDVCANRAEAVSLLKAAPELVPERLPRPDTEANKPNETKANLPLQSEAQPISRKDLAARLHRAVVLVIADKDTGSGFFVTPDTVVTNNHVVAGAKGPEVIVVGRGLDAPKRARVIARTNAQGQNERDYAILKVEGVHVDTILPLELEISELTNVVAAGFPGLLLDTDMNFRALIRGDMKAMPELAMSQGAVMAVQNRERGLPVIAHSAPISGGNSGGPLVDMCGRTVGVNTFINVAVQQASSAGFAQSSKDLATYLRSNGIAPEIAATPCAGK